MRGNKTKPPENRGHSPIILIELGVWRVTIHGFDLFTFLLNAPQIVTLDIIRLIGVTGRRFRSVAGKDFTCLDVMDRNILGSHIPTAIIALKVRGLELVRVKAGSGIDRLERHIGSLLVGSLVAPAVVDMLGIMGIVASAITVQEMGMTFFPVMVAIGMFQTNRAFALGHLVMDMHEVLTKMAFLGMSIQNLFVTFHVIHMLAKDFAMRAIGKSLGRNDDSRFSKGGMAGSLDSARANGLVILHRENFRDRLHCFTSFWGYARDWAVLAGYRPMIMISPLGGNTSV